MLFAKKKKKSKGGYAVEKTCGQPTVSMLRCTGEERVSEPFLSSIGGPWGVFLDPSFVYMSQDTWGSQLFKGNNKKPHGDY